VIATAYAALLFLNSEQTCSGDCSDVSLVPGLLAAHSIRLSTIIIAYLYICNNNFQFDK
jgi:hypothetical protein